MIHVLMIQLIKYDIITLFGTGRAMGFVVSTAEIVKRIIDNLYQVTIMILEGMFNIYNEISENVCFNYIIIIIIIENNYLHFYYYIK